MLVNILSSRRRDEGGDHEVNVGEEKEDCDWERGANWWLPVLRVAVHRERVQVEVD